MQKISNFIDSALFNSASGYYRKKNPIGKNADFITAPEISQVFGELIAAYILQIASTKKTTFSLVEMGAGKGTLFKDVLTSIQKLADKKIPQAVTFFDRATFHIIEINAVLVKIQRENLCKFSVNWHETFEKFLDHHNCEEIFFVSNELFDCFAIDQFVKTNLGWCEKIIEEIAGKKRFALREFDHEINDFVENLLGKKISQAAPINAIFEYSESARNFMSELCEALKKRGGMALIIDYGYEKTEFANTLQAIKNHQKTFILENVGKTDITALVDFFALKKIANNFDLNSSLISQREFLLALGLDERRKILLQKK